MFVELRWLLVELRWLVVVRAAVRWRLSDVGVRRGIVVVRARWLVGCMLASVHQRWLVVLLVFPWCIVGVPVVVVVVVVVVVRSGTLRERWMR